MLKGISELANIKKEYYERSATGEILLMVFFLSILVIRKQRLLMKTAKK